MATLSCIICDTELEYACPSPVPENTGNQPYAGTTFHSYGHYGSTVFDPQDGTFLELNICDKCLVICAVKGRVLYRDPRTRTTRIWHFDHFEHYGDDE